MSRNLYVVRSHIPNDMIANPYEWVMTMLSENAKIAIIETIAKEVQATHLFSDCITESASYDLNSYLDMLMNLDVEEANEQLKASEEKIRFREDIYVHDLVKIMHDTRRAGVRIAMYPTERQDYSDALALIWDYYGDNPDELNDSIADVLRIFEQEYKANHDEIYKFPGLIRLVMEQRAKTILSNLKLFAGQETILSVNPHQRLEVISNQEHDFNIYELTIGIAEIPIVVRGYLPNGLVSVMNDLEARIENTYFDIQYQ